MSPNPYERAGYVLLGRHHIKVHKWRSSNSGLAYTNAGRNEIESPRPRGPISFGVLAHEIGHIVLHQFNGKYPRWREEVEAWEFALKALADANLKGYERLETHARGCLHHNFNRAVCRGVAPDLIEETYPAWCYSVRGER